MHLKLKNQLALVMEPIVLICQHCVASVEEYRFRHFVKPSVPCPPDNLSTKSNMLQTVCKSNGKIKQFLENSWLVVWSIFTGTCWFLSSGGTFQTVYQKSIYFQTHESLAPNFSCIHSSLRSVAKPNKPSPDSVEYKNRGILLCHPQLHSSVLVKITHPQLSKFVWSIIVHVITVCQYPTAQAKRVIIFTLLPLCGLILWK